MSTQSQYLITVVVDGQPTGEWDTRTGGVTSAEVPTKVTARGTKTYGAIASTDAVTVTRTYERERDIALGARLRTRVGRAKVVVTEQPLDDDGIAYGKPTIFRGRLQSINTGDADVTSNELRDCELVITTEDAV